MEIWLLLLVLPAAWVGFSYYKGHRSPAQLQRMAEGLADGGTLLDVRTPAEFSQGHHRQARNIPLGELRAAADDLDPDKMVVLYCRSGSRSVQAMSILRSAGISQVMDLGPYRNLEKLPAIRRSRDKAAAPVPTTRNQRKRHRRRARG
jgi:phage shock protein E